MADFAFPQNSTYNLVKEPYVERNTFIGREAETTPLPQYEAIREQLPQPVWDGHESELDAYYGAWKIAFSNLTPAVPGTGIISNFIDPAFNGYTFLWDSVFMLQFGRYAASVFDFQGTLNNFYACQHLDGFISREIHGKTGMEKFEHHDPVSTGPNLLGWCEWEYYELTGDRSRIAEIFDPLMAYHNWLRLNRTWRDGSYWTTGLGSGMDNQPRLPEGYHARWSHGHMVWADATMQQILNGKILIKMAKLLGRESETDALKAEIEHLTKIVNDTLWDEDDHFYYDLWKNGEKSKVKTIGAFWALLADIVPQDKRDAFIAHLENEAEFKRPHRIPTLSADHPLYHPEGNYWCGGVWAPTNYMVLKGLDKQGYQKEAYEIGLNTVENVAKLFQTEHTFYENYAPEELKRGNNSRDNFVGWTGIIPISVLFEYVFGIRSYALEKKIVWYVNRCERHGIENYPFLGGHLRLICEKRAEGEQPVVRVSGDVSCTVEVICGGQKQIITV